MAVLFGILLYLLCEGLALLALPHQARQLTIAIFKNRKRRPAVTLAFVTAGGCLMYLSTQQEALAIQVLLPALGFPLIIYGLLRLIVPRAFEEILLRFSEYSRGQLRSIGLGTTAIASTLLLASWALATFLLP